MKYLKYIIGTLVLIVGIVALLGMYKFSYLASQPGYDADGNKIDPQKEGMIIGTITDEMIDFWDKNDINQIKDNDQYNIENNLSGSNKRKLSRYACIGEFCDGSGADDGVERTVVNVPLIQQEGSPVIGCGVSIVYAPHTVPQTQEVLNATYELLFSLLPGSEIAGDPYNTLGSYAQLYYQNVSISNGIAKVNLTGSIVGPGHCSVPEVRAQVTAAALQYDSVQRVDVYLNGKIYDWCEQDESGGEGSCPEIPELWQDSD